MKRNNTVVSSNTSRLQNSEPTANFSEHERIRHNKLATTTIPIVMLFLLTLLPEAVVHENSALMIALFIGLGAGTCALLLSWRGLVKIAGILTLIAVYAIGTFTILHYPSGLTASDLYLLDLTIIPDILVLAFFSANSLLPVACINAIQAWAILIFGPHDSTITHLLRTAPIEIFSHIYVIQMIAAIVLYLLARSTEHTLANAERAKNTLICENSEKEWKQQELDKRRQLDDGIQQILQTHVAVANGDLNARAPLLQDHDLWQVAGALNNLIARYQNLSHAERKLRHQIWEEHKRSTDQHQIYVQITGELPKLKYATGVLPTLKQATDELARLKQTTGELPTLKHATGELPTLKQATDELPKFQRDGDPSHEGSSGSPRRTRRLSNP